MSEGKIICTGRGTHKARTLARYVAEPDSFIISSSQPVILGQATAIYLRSDPDGGVKLLRFGCPSCHRTEVRVRADKMHAFLTMHLPNGATRRDISQIERA